MNPESLKRYGLKSEPVEKYLHCGNCWKVLGEIPASEPGGQFDTYDCSWECDCGRLNLSSDGMLEKYDSEGNVHFIYIRGDKEELLVKKLPSNFNFDEDNFAPENSDRA